MEVPFGWSQLLSKISGMQPLSWLEFIGETDRDKERETSLRAIRKANRESFDRIWGEERWLLKDGRADLQDDCKESDVPRIFKDWL